MAGNELLVQGGVRGPERDSGTTAGRVPAVHDLVQPDHAKPEPAQGLPGEPENEPHGVPGPREQERHVLPERGDRGAAAGGRHDGLAELHPELGAVRAGDVRRFVERPEPEAEAVHAVAGVRRAGAQRGPVRVRVLLLRAAVGGGGRR